MTSSYWASGENYIGWFFTESKRILKKLFKSNWIFFLVVLLLLPVHDPSADFWRKHPSPMQVKAT